MGGKKRRNESMMVRGGREREGEMGRKAERDGKGEGERGWREG